MIRESVTEKVVVAGHRTGLESIPKELDKKVKALCFIYLFVKNGNVVLVVKVWGRRLYCS